ncbi:CNH domain-containing protein [Cokeromyces recurvatus]|uniref:CNH domain-containing protein n=1 Tax=Cokeromyces recurvatus TaxID=90255 RepID=UPI00221F3EA4|nr:CNH domain-containing protein [Cokeromyces recurvatus]KAI7901525.1 CNH domain-containing protein [Cokeromyces recurvatus]
MSNRHHYQHYGNESRSNAQDEVEAMLNSLVGAQPYTARPGLYDNASHYYQADNNLGPPPTLPPRNESNGYIRTSQNYEMESSNKYYYPPAPENYHGYSSQSIPTTPLPQRVSSATSEPYATDLAYYPPTNYPMPVPQHNFNSASIYPPPQYDQRISNQQEGSPPGSPRHQNQQVYPPLGYPDITQEFINNSYRPTFTHQVSDASTFTSTPSSTEAPSRMPSSSSSYASGGYRPMPTSTTQPYRKPHSSLRSNMIMTIERPRYTYPSENLNGEDGEVPFIPVSPDSDSDEGEYFSNHRHHDHSSVSATVATDYQHQQKSTGTEYIDPSRFYMQPQPVIENKIMATPIQMEHQPHIEIMKPVNQSEQPQEMNVTNHLENNLIIPKREVEPNYGLLSVLSIAFARNVKGLEHVRELWCASEYNESFTGSEAITILRNLLKELIPDEYCILVANVLMRSHPPLFSPTQYSQKSLISNSVNSDDTYFIEENITKDYTPIGVIPSLTPCYSYTCRPGVGGCYSAFCPNTGKDFLVNVKVEPTASDDTIDKTITSPKGGWLVSHDAWSARMDREFLKTLDPKEIGRQEALNETIYSEEKYLADLKILHEVIVKGIEESGVIEPDRVNSFISTVFNNYQELIQMSESMFKDMLVRYRQYENECIPTIGDILVQHMQFFEEAYVKYSPHALLAKYLAEAEIKKNAEFEKFTKELAKHDRTNRLPIWHYLLSPVTRMQRYPLLIEALLKKTPIEHPDHVFLTRSHDIIKSVATKADNAATHIKKRLAILHIRDSITFKQGEFYDLQLSDPNRRLYHKGTLKRHSGTLDVTDKNDIYAFVFDHMLIMTKLRKTNTGEEYRIWNKPTPLQMLVVQNNASNTRSQLSGTTLTLHHLGSRGGTVYPFFCSSVEERQTWVKAIEDAKASLKRRQGETDVFELRPLDDVNFRTLGSGQYSGTTTRINCSVPFISATQERKIAIGTDNGVFFKTEGRDNSIRRIIQCESVIQLAVMEKYHILIVLTEKALKAYPVDALDSKSNTKAIDRVEVEIAQHVNFFQIGHCNGRDLLVFKKKKNTTSVFTALEPFCDLRDPKNEKLLTHRPSIFSNRAEYLRWFKKYKDFYIGAEASNIHFLKAKLNIVCERGFEVIDPENLTVGRDIPDSEDPEFYFVTRHSEPLKPLAMYRINDKFLLCYDKFAFYVNNRNGSLVPRPDKRKPATICDWEGNPSHIVYEHPYIIAIDPYFIEVRHVDTGELVQVISGENIRLAYYNGGGEKPIIHVCMTHNQKSDTQALYHLVLNNHRNSAGYPRR